MQAESNGAEKELPKGGSITMDLGSITEIPFMVNHGDICSGTCGMGPNPEHPDNFAALSINGCLGMFKLSEGKLLQKAKTISGTLSSRQNSLAFSPNGKFIAVSSSDESSFSLFLAKGLKMIRHWSKKASGKYIWRIKWLGNQHLMVSFMEPGVIEVISIASGRVSIKVETPSTKEFGFISDFAVCSGGSEVICGASFQGRKKGLLKLKMVNGSEEPLWVNDNLKYVTKALVLSSCGKYFLATGEYDLVIFGRVDDGEIIQKQRTFTDGFASGVIVFPNDKGVLGLCWDEFALYKLEKDGEMPLQRMNDIGREKFGKDGMTAFSLVWNWKNKGKEETMEHFVVLGMVGGSIYRVALRS